MAGICPGSGQRPAGTPAEEYLGGGDSQGYAVDEGERITGMVLVAAPVLDRNECIRAAICVAGPRNRFDEPRQQEISSLVKESANVVQVQIDYA